MKRQEVLAAAWADFKSMGVSGDDYEAKWLEVRAKHLSDADMSVPFAEPLAE